MICVYLGLSKRKKSHISFDLNQVQEWSIFLFIRKVLISVILFLDISFVFFPSSFSVRQMKQFLNILGCRPSDPTLSFNQISIIVFLYLFLVLLMTLKTLKTVVSSESSLGENLVKKRKVWRAVFLSLGYLFLGEIYEVDMSLL